MLPAVTQHGIGRCPRHHGALSTHPYTVFENDGLRHDIEGGLRVIVVSAEQQCTLQMHTWLPMTTRSRLSIKACSPIQTYRPLQVSTGI